jgi:V8-like Glu-specific endopeptidase
MKTLLVLFTLALSLEAFSAVFGSDDRVSVRQSSAGLELSRSTAIAVLSSNFEPTLPGKIKLSVDRLDQSLCPEVRFAHQTSLSYACSGFLVAPDLIVTAGHCMVNTGESHHETELYCKAFSWLFDYNEITDTQNVNADNLYKCKQVIYAVKDEHAPFRDYAIVQLNRPVKGRLPFKLNVNPVKPQDVFGMIGYPMGLPAKYSKNGRILVNNSNRQSFLTNLDAFEGNSGSGVFNAKNEIVGILVGGTPSANTLTKGRCEILNRCSECGTQCLLPDKDTSIFPGYQGVGSEVQRIGPILKLIQKLR